MNETREHCLQWIYRCIYELSANAKHNKTFNNGEYDFDEQDLETVYKLQFYLQKYVFTDWDQIENNTDERRIRR